MTREGPFIVWLRSQQDARSGGFTHPLQGIMGKIFKILLFVVLTFFLTTANAFAQGSGPSDDQIRQCIVDIQRLNDCNNTVLRSVTTIDSRVTPTGVEVIAQVDVAVTRPFDGCSPAAKSCTGTCWNMENVRWTNGLFGDRFFVLGQGLRVNKRLQFEKWQSGWRCITQNMTPVEAGFYLNGK